MQVEGAGALSLGPELMLYPTGSTAGGQVVLSPLPPAAHKPCSLGFGGNRVQYHPLNPQVGCACVGRHSIVVHGCECFVDLCLHKGWPQSYGG